MNPKPDSKSKPPFDSDLVPGQGGRPTRLGVISLLAIGLALATGCRKEETDRDLFLQTDVNRDGRLTLQEVNRTGLPRLFNRFDLNGDGSVTLVEARRVTPDFDQKLFVERDLDSDGKVTYAEYESVALKRGALTKYFSAVDTDGNGFIEMSEAQAYVDRLDREEGR